LSKAEVASSRSRILGFLRKALAIAILYFCPPESYPPPDPTKVSRPLSNFFLINDQALASIKAY